LAVTASTTTRPTQPMASQNRMPMGLDTKMSSESRCSLWRDTTKLVDGGQAGDLVAEEPTRGAGVGELPVVRHASLPGHPGVDHGEEEVDE